MANYNVKYKIGDEIYVRGTVERIEIINHQINYKICECEELIPQDIAFPKMENATVNLIKGDFSALEDLENKINDLNLMCEQARTIIDDLACKEIIISVKPVVL